MVTVLNTESGTQILSANLQSTIDSIREIVGNHSDSDIYNALKESYMDPNETAQKLLNQDHFHEVRRRRDKKKENGVYNGYIQPRKRSEFAAHGAKLYSSDLHVHRGGHSRSAVYDVSINPKFRVVRNNRGNHNSDTEAKDLPQVSSSVTVQQSNMPERSVSVPSSYQRHLGGRYVQSPNGVNDFRSKLVGDFKHTTRRLYLNERRSITTSSRLKYSMMRSTNSQNSASSNIVCASGSDLVHAPSSESRTFTTSGALRPEVRDVGNRRQFSDNTLKQSFQQAESAIVSSVSSRVGNHFNNKLHPQIGGQQKASKQWKPKTSQKPIGPSSGVVGSPVESASKTSKTVDGSENVGREADLLENKFSRLNIHESQKVIIAQHIHVPKNDRCRLTFGSFDLESDGTENSTSTLQAPESESVVEALTPLLSNEQIDSADDQVPGSSLSTLSSEAAEYGLPQQRDSYSIPDTEYYTDVPLVHHRPSFVASKSQQQDTIDFPNFSAYDPRPVYDIPYFRPSADDTVGEPGPGVPSPQEGLSHVANNIPLSSVVTMQQQASIAQMYPQLHVSHFANVMPYRHPPLYVPPMVQGYSGNPGYPHLSNGSNYVLMHGGSNPKYGVQQFKPLPVGSPAGFCNFANPTAYAVNAPGVVGGPVGLDDFSRMKYKDSNLYAPNLPAETSELWIHNQREVAGIQSPPYFQGQTGAQAAYLQSHTGHASFNAAAMAQQSSHVQFPGMYPPQPNVMPNAHHNMNISVGVGPTAPGGLVGGFQQHQLSHLNWTANF